MYVCVYVSTYVHETYTYEFLTKIFHILINGTGTKGGTRLKISNYK